MSSDGWMLTGDAGPFSDPFYSPGSDFIAFANGYITELIATDASPERFAEFQRHFLAFFSNTISIYRGLYPCMGHRDLMVLKTLWDYTYYWAVLSKLFFTGRYTDTAFMRSAQPQLLKSSAMNSGFQRLLKGAAGSGRRVGGESGFHDYHAIPLFRLVSGFPRSTIWEDFPPSIDVAASPFHESAAGATQKSKKLNHAKGDASTWPSSLRT
jgi:hypothetical protein